MFSNIAYPNTPGFWTGFSLLAWNLLVLSASTSFLAMYYGIRAYVAVVRSMKSGNKVAIVGFLLIVASSSRILPMTQIRHPM